jgi:hypothetical protein
LGASVRPPRFHFTTHAVERFIERVAPGTNPHQALIALKDAARTAIATTFKTRAGDSIWRVEQPAMRLVTKPDINGTVVVTILEGHTGGEEDALDEVMDAYRRLQNHPELGTPELVRPCDVEDRKDVGAWATIETHRLLTERRRLQALASLEGRAEVAAGKREDMRGLLRDAAVMLAEIDARKSAGLLSRIDFELRRSQ